LAGGILLAASPAFVAHGTLATTDATMTATYLLALYALAAYQARPSIWRWCGLSCAIGLAWAAKYTTVVLLLPLLVVIGASPGKSAWWRKSLMLAGTLVVAGWVVWAGHGFATLPALDGTGSSAAAAHWLGRGATARAFIGWLEQRKVPMPLLGLLYQTSHVRHGEPTFLDGERGRMGWWRYYPLVLAYKGTPAEWLLVLLAFGSAATAWRAGGSARLWLVGAAGYAGFLMWVTVALGQRLMLVLLVLSVLLAVDAIAAAGRRWAALVWGLLLLMQFAAVASIAPRYLTYFSPLAGGAASGYQRLVDSNLDWGQGLIDLAGWWQAAHRPPLALAYHGEQIVATTRGPVIPLACYGLDARHPLDDPLPAVLRCQWLVISATQLQGVARSGDRFATLRALTPDLRIGAIWFAWRMERSDVRHALVQSRR
jgi:4-amino-4-deoxy-L-arabinose transferase-like glycosyltransferase